MNNDAKTQILIAEELIASFGEARLVRRDGRICLIGGSMADRSEAMEWAMLFLPDESIRLRE